MIESKSLLAKLLAEENIVVEFKKTTTASANLKDRILILPELKEGISNVITTLFIGHEVGHFLFTDFDEWNIARKEVSKDLLNICEDVRIEKKIQQNYPGLKTDFIKGYKELNSERDFFNIKGKDLNNFEFIDRLNLRTKLGAGLMIKFSDKELEFVERAETITTFEEVVSLSKEIEEFIKKQEQKKEKEQESSDENSEEPEEPSNSCCSSGVPEESDDGEEYFDSNNSEQGFDYNESVGKCLNWVVNH